MEKETKNTYAKFEEDLQKMLNWKRDPETFIRELLAADSNEQLFLAVRKNLARFNSP